MRMRKRDLQGMPSWQLGQWCSCGRWFEMTVTLSTKLANHLKLSWRDVAAAKLRMARRQIRQHIKLDEKHAHD